MAFIDTVSVKDATGETREMYRRQQGKGEYVPGYAKIFSHRPEVMARWADLLKSVKSPMSHKHFELATLAAAITLKSTNCSLAHAGFLGQHFSEDEILEIVSGKGEEAGVLTAAEQALFEFARLVVTDASAVTRQDIDKLKATGFSDDEIFDIAAAAAARCFFATLVDSLGSQADVPFDHLGDTLREALIVGRPLEREPPEAVSQPA